MAARYVLYRRNRQIRHRRPRIFHIRRSLQDVENDFVLNGYRLSCGVPDNLIEQFDFYIFSNVTRMSHALTPENQVTGT